MNWLDVQGQMRAMRLLQMAWAGGRMPHAWLFHGPSGVGKEMLATRFARLLLCEQPATIAALPAVEAQDPWHDGCKKCRSCHLVEAGTHPDLHLVHRALNKHHPDPAVRSKKALDISVEVIRHFLLDPVRGRSAMGRAKVYIVRDAELLSTAAQNALLKTLEEPPADTYLVLLSSAKDRLLPTTISRCQSVAFGPLEVETAERIVAVCGLAAEDARFYAWLSEGRPGWAMHLARFGLREGYVAIGEGLARIGSSDPLQVAGEWGEASQRWAKSIDEKADEDEGQSDEPSTDTARQGLNALFVVLSSLLREAMRVGAAGLGQSPATQGCKSLAELSKWSAEGLAGGIKEISSAEGAIARNAAPPLTLEALAVKLARFCRG